MTGHNFFFKKNSCANRILLWYNLPPFFDLILRKWKLDREPYLILELLRYNLKVRKAITDSDHQKKADRDLIVKTLNRKDPGTILSITHAIIAGFILSFRSSLKFWKDLLGGWQTVRLENPRGIGHSSLQQNMAEGVKSKRLAGCCKMETEW